MARLTYAAMTARVGCLLLSAMAARIAVSADSGGSSRYVMAPANPTFAPADPTKAPGDPTFAPGDPRETYEPRDMTSPRAVRRSLRGRSRDRVAPDQPTTSGQPLRDLTDTPIASGKSGLGRRFESLLRLTPSEKSPANARHETVRMAPAEPQMVAPAAPLMTRVAPAAPSPNVEVATPTEPPIQLAQGRPEAAPMSAPAIVHSPPENLAVDEERVRSLNKPLQQIALIEPVDVDGLRPADISAELEPAQPPLILTGSFFAQAHPDRYLYCFRHNPLYFEDANLERCGIRHSCCQPAASAAKFLSQAALWPYSLIVTPPGSCVTTLGDCPTCHSYPCGADYNH